MTRELQDLIDDLWFAFNNPDYVDVYTRMTLSQRVDDALEMQEQEAA
jgi:hypothetical protein